MHRSVPAALALAAALLTGCGSDDFACTAIGGLNGITVEFAQELWVAEGDVEFTVCDDEGCETASQHMARLTKGQGGGRPEARPSFVTFKKLGRVLDDGTVQVKVELSDGAGRLVALREQDVELMRDWPNGKKCDGDGYVSGHLELLPADAVPAPA